MEQVGINSVQQVQYQQKQVANEPSFTGNPETKVDGDKKLMGALAGLAAIGVGCLAFVDLKKGDASKIRKVAKNIGDKFNSKKLEKAAKKGTDAEYVDLAKHLEDKTPEEITKFYKLAQKNIGEILTQIKAKQTRLTALTKEIAEKQKTYDELLAKLSKEKGDKAAGLELAEKMKAQLTSLVSKQDALKAEIADLTTKKELKSKLAKKLKPYIVADAADTSQAAVDKSIARHNKKMSKQQNKS